MEREIDFTQGEITRPLIRFAIPIMLAILLQDLYGSIDTLIVGHFASSAEISAVSTGAEIMFLLTDIAGGLTMGVTVKLGHLIGGGDRRACGQAVGTGITLFAIMGLAFSVIMFLLAKPLATILNAPAEAFDATVGYLRICGAGSLVVFAYNFIGSIFRGLGDSRTPLLTVAIAAVFNIAGDLVLVAVLGMGAKGAAIATVGAQALSVVISYAIIKRRTLPFDFDRSCLRVEADSARALYKLGIPVALQGVLADLSFTIIMSFVNGLGVIASAGVGVASKICVFINLVTASFMQSVTSFVAQNYGAKKMDRARLALRKSLLISAVVSVIMFGVSFFLSEQLVRIFTSDTAVIAASAAYLKAYAIDCLLISYELCIIGFFNGIGKTRFAMFASLAGAFLVRVPLSYIFSRMVPISMFRMGMAVPISTVVELAIVVIYYLYLCYNEDV